MTEPHVVSALRSKRAEISGYLHDLEKQVRTWRTRLVHIDASIKIFSPETDPQAIPPRRTYRRSGYFQRGEFARLCLDEFRKTNGPVSTAILAKGIMMAKRLLPDDPALLAAFNEKALVFLRGLVKRGTVIKTGTSRDARWGLS